MIMIKKIILLIIFTLYASISNAELDLLSLDIPERQPIKSPITTYDPNTNSYPDPFSEDKIIITIDQNNYTNYEKNLLTPGQLEMFKTYPETFKMHVYQSRRSCAVPKEVIELTMENAT